MEGVESETDSQQKENNVFEEIRSLINVNVPEQVKHILQITGFESVHLLSKINEKVLIDIEKQLREDLHDVLSTTEMEKVYGVFHKNPGKFRFLTAHKHFLLELPKLLSECEKNKTRINKNNAKRSVNTQNVEELNVVPEEKNECIKQNVRKHLPINLTEENAHIWKTLKNWIKAKTPEAEWCAISKNFNNVTVATRFASPAVDSELVCVIKCFCGSSYKLKKVSKQPNAPQRWIYGSYYKHWQRDHLSNLKASVKKNPSIMKFLYQNEKRDENLNKEHDIQNTSDDFDLPSTSKAKLSNEAILDDSFDIAPPSNQRAALPNASVILPDNFENAASLEENEENSKINILSNVLISTIDKNKTETPLKTLGNADEVGDNSADKNTSKWASLKYQRSEREKRLREKCNTEDQTLITDYFQLSNKIMEIIAKNEERHHLVLEPNIPPHVKLNYKVSSSLLNDLLAAVSLENSRGPKNKNNYNSAMKDFGLYLYYVGGRCLYETLQSNLKNALPSISTLNRHVSKKSSYKQEGLIDLQGLLSYLEKNNLPKIVWISEDATRITARVEYDSKTNKLVGFVLPLKNGLPQTQTYLATSAKKIEEHFQNGVIANFVQVIMAQPLKDGTPPFCLSLFGTDNKYKAEDVLSRWNFIRTEAQKYQIIVAGFSSDGDAKLLKAMRLITDFPFSQQNVFEWDWYHMGKGKGSECCFQDTVHILTKMRTRFLKDGIVLPLGDYFASVDHLKLLISKFGKDKHLLTSSDLSPEDKMNFRSAQKMSSDRVINLLDSVPESNGTRVYLKIMRYIESAFLDSSLDVQDRIYRIWYCVFFSRIWKSWIKKKTQITR